MVAIHLKIATTTDKLLDHLKNLIQSFRWSIGMVPKQDLQFEQDFFSYKFGQNPYCLFVAWQRQNSTKLTDGGFG